MMTRKLAQLPSEQSDNEIRFLPINSIQPPATKIREDIRGLARLSESIRAHGVLQPLIVVEESEELVEIVCGLRRWHAAKEANLTHVPCVVKRLDPSERVQAMLAENMQRSSLSRTEEARGYQVLVEMGYSHRAIGKVVGKSAAHVCKRLRLLQLPPAVQVQLETRTRSMTLNSALGYTERPRVESFAADEDAFAADEALQRAWLDLRAEVISRGDSRILALLAAFARAHASRYGVDRPARQKTRSRSVAAVGPSRVASLAS